MDRKQGLKLVELYFGPKPIHRTRGRDHLQFDIPIQPKGDSCDHLISLLSINQLPQYQWEQEQLHQQFGDQKTDWSQKQAYRKQLESQWTMKIMRPILDLLAEQADYEQCTSECQVLIETLANNERICREYKLRIDGWNQLMDDWGYLSTDEDDQPSFTDLIPYMPWLKVHRNQRVTPADLHKRLTNFPDEKAKLQWIERKVNETIRWYDKFHQKHADLLLKIAGDRDLWGNDWAVDSINDEIIKRLDRMEKGLLSLESEPKPIKNWLSILIENGVIHETVTEAGGKYWYPIRSMTELVKQLKRLCKELGVSEPKKEEIHKIIKKPDGSSYNLKTVKNA